TRTGAPTTRPPCRSTRRTWRRRVMPADGAVPPASPVLGERFASAVEWATELHGTQVRKGSGVPYVAHLLEVAALVLHDGGTESEAIAGLLHDAVEDAGVKPKQIRKRYGRKVSRIVKACTETLDGKLPTKSKAPRDASTWRTRKQETIEHLTAPAVPTPVLRVKG